jgi:hypothetical protein
VGSAPAPATPHPDPAPVWLAKLAMIDAGLEALAGRRRAALERGDDRRREALERQIALQERRREWIRFAAESPVEAIASRARALEDELGDEACFLEAGLPGERSDDVRLLDQLAELAILRLALKLAG